MVGQWPLKPLILVRLQVPQQMNIVTTTDPKVPAEFLADKILEQLKANQKVLWLVPGGSAIQVAVLAAKRISGYPHFNLVVTVTDERHGAVGHKDSNWQHLIDMGFDLPQAKLIPVLTVNGEQSRTMTTEKFNTIIDKELKNADYKIGLFGIGADGHTAGILPMSGAVEASESVFGYQAPQFERITITPKALTQLNEAVIWAQGEAKWKIIQDLDKEIDRNLQPAQVLKKVPTLTIFTDYIK